MSKEHMIFLAGRKEYNGSLGNGSHRQPNSNQSDVSSLADMNMSDDVLERYMMNNSGSVEESMSINSFESGTSDLSEVIQRRSSRPMSSQLSSTPLKRVDNSFKEEEMLHVSVINNDVPPGGGAGVVPPPSSVLPHQLSTSQSANLQPPREEVDKTTPVSIWSYGQ